jgi:hypothetical protein
MNRQRIMGTQKYNNKILFLQLPFYTKESLVINDHVSAFSKSKKNSIIINNSILIPKPL